MGGAIASIDPTTESGLANLATAGQAGLISSAGDKLEGSLLGGDAADAALEAAEIQAAAQREGLEYLKETEALPQAFRQAGLTQLSGLAGITIDPETGQATFGDPTGQQALIDQAMASPLYSSIMGTAGAGEEAIARSRSATGGLRGGATAADLAEFNQQLQQDALLQSYSQQLGGIQQLAGLPSAAPMISQQYGQIGETEAMGQVGAAQAQQQAYSNLLNLGGALGSAAIISDVRLKNDVSMLSPTSHPYIYNYEWEWLPESGKEGRERGFIAQEVEKVWPDLVVEGEDGYKRILKSEVEQRLKEIK
jgi:hypothetical protein